MDARKKRKASQSAGRFIETVRVGECATDIYLKREPSGFRHHAYTPPVKRRKGPSGKDVTTRSYTSQDEAELLQTIRDVSTRCRELDARLFGMKPTEAA